MATPRWKSNRIEWARANKRRLDLLVCHMTPAELRGLSRADAVERLLEVVAGWEAVTGRGQDLSRERLEEESTSALRKHLAWYCSEEARALMADHLVELLRELL